MPTFTNQLPPEIQAEYDKIIRRQNISDALVKQSLAPNQTQMTGGKYSRAVPYSPLQGGLNLVQAALANRAQKRNQAELTNLANQYKEKVKASMEEAERQRLGLAPWGKADPTGAALRATTDDYLKNTGYADIVTGLEKGKRGAYSSLAQAYNPETEEMENVIVDTRGIPGQNVYRLGGERYDLPFISAKDPRVSAVKKKKEKLAEREAEKIIDQSRMETNIETEKFKLENLDNTIDLALEQTEGFAATAIGSQLTSWIGGTPAGDLAATLSTLEAEAGFGRLEEMKEASKTGGALGQVSERELELLTTAFAALKQKQSKEQLQKNLKKFKNQYRESWKRINDAYYKDYGTYYMDPKVFNPGSDGQPNPDEKDPLGIL